MMHLELYFLNLQRLANLFNLINFMLLCQNRLECEKTELITELNKLHKEKEAWALQKSELEMTQAELSAENSQLRSELNNKVL